MFDTSLSSLSSLSLSLSRFMADRSRAPVPGVPFEQIIVASEAKREPEPKQRETQSTERDRAKAKRDPEQRETQSRHTWRVLGAALVCGSKLGAALSGPAVHRPTLHANRHAKMPTRAPSALAGQVVKTLVASSLVKPTIASSEAMEVFAHLNDLYLATVMIFGLYITVVTITILVLYMQFMGESTTSTAPPASILRQIASLDLLLATPNADAHLDLTTTRVDTARVDTTRMDTPRMAVTPTPPPPEPPPAISIGSEVPPPPPPTAVEVATTATSRSRASLARLRALDELRRLHREQGPRRCHSC